MPNSPAIAIRRATDDDFPAIWPIFRTVVAAGETYVFAPDTSEAEARRLWLELPLATYVAIGRDRANGGDRVVGTYYLKPNQPGLGAHVANAGYMVAPEARGRGIGRAMGEHSLAEARRLGFLAMQFNFVVATNAPALALWRSLGFAIAGTLPKAFRHPQLGFADAHVMYRWLDDGGS